MCQAVDARGCAAGVAARLLMAWLKASPGTCPAECVTAVPLSAAHFSLSLKASRCPSSCQAEATLGSAQECCPQGGQRCQAGQRCQPPVYYSGHVCLQHHIGSSAPHQPLPPSWSMQAPSPSSQPSPWGTSCTAAPWLQLASSSSGCSLGGDAAAWGGSVQPHSHAG